MKKINLIQYLIFIMIILLNTDCKKETPAGGTAITPSTNTSPHANAGEDMLVFFPADFCTLNGGDYDLENNISTTQWNKISGPASFLIERPGSLGTIVSNLEKGVYAFELTVTDKAGLTGKDTATVTVGKISSNANEIIFKDLSWDHEAFLGTLLWPFFINIENIYSYLPTGSVFKAYIKRDTSTDWVEVVQGDYNARYHPVLMNGDLSIGSDYDETDTPDVKIVY